MIRILHTIDTTGPGGAETVFVNLIKGLDRSNFEPTVVIKGPGWVYDELSKNGITPIFINSKGSLNFKYLVALIKVIREKKIDIIQSHLLGSNLYCSLAGLLCSIPVVSTFHGFIDIHAKERFLALKNRIINHGSSRLIFVSDLLRNFYVNQKGFLDKKAITIYNGVDTSLFKPQRDDSIRKKLGISPDNILVGSVGNIRPAKGYDYLLGAARIVIDQYPQFRFVVAGQGPVMLYDALLHLRKELELEDHFFFWGFEADVPRFMNNLDIFVLPSISEGFSISTIEAMACGVPVIVTRSGGPEEIITGNDGILIDARNTEDLAKYIISLTFDQSLKHAIIIKSIERITGRFTNENMIRCYDEIYSSLC